MSLILKGTLGIHALRCVGLYWELCELLTWTEMTRKIYSCPHFHSMHSWAMRRLEVSNGLAPILSDC